MEPESVEQEDGTYRWNPRIGREYRLEYFQKHWRCTGFVSVEADYFGSLNREHVFFREEEGKVFKYTRPVDLPLSFLIEEDHPSIPVFQASYEGEIPDGFEKEFILTRLSAHKKTQG